MSTTLHVCRPALRRALAYPTCSSAVRHCPRRVLFFSTSPSVQNAAAAAPPPPTPASQPAAGEAREGAAAAAATAAKAKSSCPEGTVLKGLNYLKGKTDPVARKDEDYPDWLWDCLSVMKKKASTEDEDAGDEFSKSKKQRRLAAKRQRVLESKLASGEITAPEVKVPLQHQSINLVTGEGGPNDLDSTLLAAAKRTELRVALRKERRAKIKESNYLRSM